MILLGGVGEPEGLPSQITQAQPFGLPSYRVWKATRKGCVWCICWDVNGASCEWDGTKITVLFFLFRLFLCLFPLFHVLLRRVQVLVGLILLLQTFFVLLLLSIFGRAFLWPHLLIFLFLLYRFIVSLFGWRIICIYRSIIVHRFFLI